MELEPKLIIHPIDFPMFLKAKLSNEDLTVTEFATKLGVSPKHVYMMLKGERQPGKEILQYLGLEVYYGVPGTASKAKK